MMDKRKRGNTLPGLISGLVFVIVLPTLLLFFALHSSSGYLRKNIENEIWAGLRRDVARIRRELNSTVFIQRKLNLAYGMMAEETVNSANLGKRLQILKKQGLDFVNFRFFDAERRLIAVDGESESFKVILERIYSALHQATSQNDGALLLRYRPMFDAFLGSINPVAVVAEKSGLIKVLIKGRPGYFYWNLFYSPAGDGSVTGGMIAWFSQNDVPVNLAEKQLLPEYSDNESGAVAGVLDLTNAGLSFPLAVSDTYVAGGLPVLSRVIAEMQRESVPEKMHAGKFIVTVPLASGRILYILAPGPGQAVFSRLLVQIFMLVFLPYAVYFCLVELSAAKSWKQIFIARPGQVVLVVAAIPVIAFSSIWLDYIELQKQNLAHRAREKISRHFELLEEGYAMALDNLENRYRQLPDSYAFKTGNFARIAAEFAGLKQSSVLQRLYILNRKGRVLLSLPEQNAGNGGLVEKLMAAVARKLFVAKFGGEQSWKDKIDDAMLESVAANFTDLLGDITSELFKPFEDFDHIGELSLAGKKHYVFSTFFNLDEPDNALLMIAWQGVDSFAENYLRGQILKNLSTSEDKQPIRLGMASNDADKLPFPADFAKYPFVKQMIEHARTTFLPQFSQEEIAGENYFVAVAPIGKIPAYTVIAIMPAVKEEQEINRLRMLMAMAVMVCLSSSFWVARSIAS